MGKAISPMVLEVLGKSIVNGTDLFLTGQLARSDYEAVAKTLLAAGGKWDKRAKCHRFDGDAEDRIQMMLSTGEVTDLKKEFGFFETPTDLARKVVHRAQILDGHDVLEPSAGRGALARAALLEPIKLGSLDCVEIQPDNAEALRASLPSATVVEHDFLEITPEPLYDRIVMNPPFAKQADIKHVGHALSFLRPGGRLVAIMSAAINYRQDKRTLALREWMGVNGYELEGLPEGSFKSSGTSVNTVMVTAEGPSS